MNLLDIILLVLVAMATLVGYRVGLVARVFSWAGLLAGLVLAVLVTPAILDAVNPDSPEARLMLGIGVFVVVLGVVGSLADLLGFRLRSLLHRGPIRPLDQAGGAVTGALGVLVVLWLLLPVAAEVPGPVARQVRQSAITGLVTRVAPSPPNTVRALSDLVSGTRFPDVFADLRPAPDTGAPPSQLPLTAQTLARVEAATVNVESIACRRRSEGSGFLVAPETVVTNAHVVAGTEDLQVRRPTGEVLDARVVAFNEDRDVAVLRAPGLTAPTLPLVDTQAGVEGAAVGYPGGQNEPRAMPAVIESVRTVVGRDIYGRGTVRRQVAFLAANLAQGDSGGPLVDPQGRVVGVVFAISPDRATTTYALATSEVRAVLDAPRRPGVAGACL